MKNPKVSILMPCYNGMPFIKASIASILNQTYSNWECIIVDDGSTDSTHSYLQSLNDSRFRIFTFDKNKGRPLARQKSLDEASGELIAMLDAGDIYHPQKLSRQVSVFEKYDSIVLVSANMCSFGLSTNILRKRGSQVRGMVKFDGKVPNHASSMIKTSVAKLFQYNPLLKMGQDKDFLEKLLDGKMYYDLPDILYYYSEFDSVTKTKIIETHRLQIVNLFKLRKCKNMFYEIFKYVLCVVIYPFININCILQRRGIHLTNDEYDDYNKYCLTLIHEINELK